MGEKTDTTRAESTYRRRERRASRPADTTKEDKKVKFKGEATNGFSESQSSSMINNGLDVAGTEVNGVESRMKTGPRSAKFEEGDDFISLVSVESDEETATKNRRDTKGKGKEIDEGVYSDKEKPRRRKEEKGREGYQGMTESRAKDKSSRISNREWDKGKRYSDDDDNKRRSRRKDRDVDRDRNGNGNHKRKYDEYANEQKYEKNWQRDAFSKKCPWMSGVDLERCHNVAEILHREVESFVHWVSPTPVEDEVRGLIIDHIAVAVKTSFRDAQVFPFGSYQTKLYLPTGDIDLVVLSDSMAYSDKTTVLHVLANALKRNGVTSHVTIIAKAKVPIVKFISTYGRFKVDISINQNNGLFSGKIITGFLKDLVPCSEGKDSTALRSLIMITKAFLGQRNMNEVYTGGLGSYGVVCLAVSFLQMHPKIRRGEIDPEKNLGVLVMEFFELYGKCFNYDEVGISLRDGGTYFNKRQRGWHAEYKKNMLSIEDPADPSNDISSGSYNFHKVKTAFAGAHGILTSTAYLRAGMLGSRHQGRSVQLRSQYEPEDLSILSTVMGITQETINHRRLVQELYDKRTLHRILCVKPRATVIHVADDTRRQSPRGQESPSSRIKNSGIVESAWNVSSCDEAEYGSVYNKRRRRYSSGREDEGGRYDIGRRSHKRFKKEDPGAVYVAYDDEDEPEEGEYARPIELDNHHTARQAKGNTDKKRSYWLAKATVDIGDAPP